MKPQDPIMCLKTFALATCILVLDCVIKSESQKSNNHHQQQSQFYSNGPIMQQQQQNYSFGHSPRPLDRPSLSLVASNSSLASFTAPPTNGQESPADWFLMGGAVEDLLTGEGKNVASVMELGGRNSSAKRNSGQKRKSQATKSSQNKTLFDDEQASDSSDSNEIFDDADESSQSLAGTQKEPDCASHGRYYCTYKEEYPLKLVTEVTKYYKWPLEKLFRDLHAQIMPKLAQDSTGNLVCDSITRVVRPGWTRNTNDRWLVVINTENYHQYVTEVVCQYGSNSRCNFIPPCYYSSCQQRYNTQKLLVIDPTNPYRGPFLSEFLFPSCCVCYVPSASDTFQDKYRSSPANIYQRTMQQEAANNLYPPQFRPTGLMEEVQASSMIDQSPVSMNKAGSLSSQKQGTGSMGQMNPANQPLGPGEIRRGGDQYNRRHEQSNSSPSGSFSSQTGEQQQQGGDLRDFPRLGMSDAAPDQQPGPSANS